VEEGVLPFYLRCGTSSSIDVFFFRLVAEAVRPSPLGLFSTKPMGTRFPRTRRYERILTLVLYVETPLCLRSSDFFELSIDGSSFPCLDEAGLGSVFYKRLRLFAPSLLLAYSGSRYYSYGTPSSTVEYIFSCSFIAALVVLVGFFFFPISW